MAKKTKTKLVVCISIFLIITTALLVSLAFSSKIEKALGIGKVLGTTLENPKLKVEAIDVGQGAASLTTFPDGKIMLVDAGTNKSEDKLVSYLKKRNITKIDYFVLTHSDNDHTGGADAVYENFEVVCTYRPFVLSENPTYPNCDPLLHYKTDLGADNVTFIDGVDWAKCVSLMYSETYTENGEQKQSAVRLTNAGDYIVAGEAIVRFWWPYALAESDEVVHDAEHLTVNPTYGKPTQKCNTLNNYSAVISVTYYEMNMIITGDAASKVEKDLMDSFSDADRAIFSRVFVYFAGHHGSNSSNCEEWLALLDARYVVVQCGENNSHPGKNFLERVEKQFKSGKGGTLLATDDNGDIVFMFSHDSGSLESAVSYSGNAKTISVTWWEIVVAGIAVAAVVLLVPLIPRRKRR